ncbi:hypothetical protein ACSLOD_28660, partial [Escherichia coli]
RSLRSVMRLRRALPAQSCGKQHHCRAERGKTAKDLLLKKTPEIQAKRGRKGGIAKGEAYDDKRFMALCMLENGYSQKAIAA